MLKYIFEPVIFYELKFEGKIVWSGLFVKAKDYWAWFWNGKTIFSVKEFDCICGEKLFTPVIFGLWLRLLIMFDLLGSDKPIVWN